MSHRPSPAILLSSLLLGALSGASSAAPKSCNVITDPAGDANDPLQTGVHPHPVASNANLDIVGGDFAASSTAITGVIKLAKAPGLDPLSPQGHYIYLEFQPSVSPHALYLQARVSPSGAVSYGAGTITSTPAGAREYTPSSKIAVKGKVSGTSIVITVTNKALAPLVTLRPQARINAIKASSFASVQVPDNRGLLLSGDLTQPAKPFIAGTPSCVAPVR